MTGLFQYLARYRSHACCTAFIAGCFAMQAGDALADDVVLRYNRWLPTASPLDVDGMLPFFEEVERVTEGRVRVEPTTASLAPAPRQLEIVRAGVVDVSFGGQSMTPGLFPLADAVALPFIGASGEAVGVAFWRTYNEHFAAAEPYPGVHILTMTAVTPYQIYSVEKPINNIDDLAGMKMRATGSIAPKIAEALGATPVPIDISGMYDAFSKGILDGGLNNDDQIRAFDVAEYIKYRLAIPGGLLGTPLYVAINQAKWDEISQDDQAAIMEIAGEKLAASIGRAGDVSSAIGMKQMQESGTTMVSPDDTFLAEIRERLQPLEVEWLEKASSLGVDGAAALAMMRSVAEEVEASKAPVVVD